MNSSIPAVETVRVVVRNLITDALAVAALVILLIAMGLH
jgi:hypothetical protein